MGKLILKYAFILILALAWQPVSAEVVKIVGMVTDLKTGKPLPNVLVAVRPVGKSNVVKFTQTTSEGKFELALTSKLQSTGIYLMDAAKVTCNPAPVS